MISETEKYAKRKVQVEGLDMAYVDVGEGNPIVFLHGNPTSSYLWRNIISYVEKKGRCIAPDLIGMGDSAKLPNSGPDSYTYADHRRYLDGFLDAIGIEKDVVLVIHDWGSALGFDWAHRHPDAVKGIAYMEAIVKPFSFADLNEDVAQAFQAMRAESGEAMVIGENFFIETLMPSLIERQLSERELDAYRRPYLDGGESRRPMLTWPRQIPFDGYPADVHAIVTEYSAWLHETPIPKLFVNSNPGVIMEWSGTREYCREFPNQTEITVQGYHYVQEDCPDEIGQELGRWIETL